MKRLIAVFSLISIFILGSAQGPVTPRKSPLAIAKFQNADYYIKVTYSQPHKNNRVIFGDLVPYGKIWRLGANEATELTLTRAITIGGKKIAPGTYSLFAIPTENQWTLIVSKQLGLWGSFDYDQAKDACRIDLPVSKNDTEWEAFTIKLENPAKDQNVNMIFMWDKVKVVAPIKLK